jgi:hypothetical protein
MPRNRRLSLIALCASIAVTIQANACPYCPRTDSTLSEKLAESDAACVVKFLDSKQGEELSMETTRFEVVKLMRPGLDLKEKSQFTTPFGVTGREGDLFILIGQMKEGSIEWNLPIPVDSELLTEFIYLKNAPAPELPANERLPYFLKFLDSPNTTVSNDAFGEFSKARFEDVEQLSPKISRAKVRSWLEDPNPQLDVRRAFYGMLLGLSGNDDDARYLERRILAPIDPTKNRFGIDGMMGGYLLLTGQRGLQLLISKKVDSLRDDLSNDDIRLVDLNALRTTISFIWDYRRTQFGRDELCAAMRRFLDWPQVADLAVIDLARWKDWTPLDHLIAAYGREPWDSRSAKEKIVAYALSCRKDAQAAAGSALPAHAIKAQKFLDNLEPEFVQSVRRMTGGLSAVSIEPAASKKLDSDRE